MNPSHDYDKILTRLTTILQRLYEGEALSVTELAKEFNVSTKTIQRDFNERLIRFPIEKSGRRWRMREGHRLEKVQDIDNLLTLQILETLAKGAGQSFARRSKALLGRLKNDAPLPVHSYLSIEDITSHAALFRETEEAIVGAKVLAFDYHGKPRRVHPYRIVNFDGYWYLLAYEPASGLVKKFYMKEMERLATAEESFAPDTSLQTRIEGALNAWFDPNEEPFEIHLLARAPIVKYLHRRPLSPRQHIVARHENGDVEVVLHATTEKEALELLKLWIPDLVVLAPASLKRSFQNLLKKSLDFQTGHDAV
ncbi:helix-turn-helix transcriptional regulator [Hydrogenimonas sp.]